MRLPRLIRRTSRIALNMILVIICLPIMPIILVFQLFFLLDWLLEKFWGYVYKQIEIYKGNPK